MRSYRVITSIAPQPSSVIDLAKKWTSVSPLHISNCKNKVVYAVDTGVAVRSLPNRIPRKGDSQVRIYGVAKRPLTCASASRDGRVIVGGNADGHVHIWVNRDRGGGRGGEATGGLGSGPGHPAAAALPSSRKSSSTIHNVYKLDKMRHLHMSDICVSDDSELVVAVGYERHGKVHGAVLDADSGCVLGFITAHNRPTNHPQINGYSGIASVTMTTRKPYNIVTAGLDGRLCLFTGPPYKLKLSVDTNCNALTCARYSPDGTMLVCLGIDGYMAVYDQNLALVSDADLGSVTPLSCDWLSRKGTQIFAIACDDKSVHVLKVDPEKHTINVLFNLSLVRDHPRGILWTDNMWIVVPTESGVILSWACLCEGTELDLEFHGSSTRGGRGGGVRRRGSIRRSATPPQNRHNKHLADTTSSDDSESTDDSTADVGKYEVCAISDAPDLISYGLRGGASVVHYDALSKQMVVGTNLGYLMFLDCSHIIPRAFQVKGIDYDRRILACLTNGSFSVSLASNGKLKFLKYIRKTAKPELLVCDQLDRFRDLLLDDDHQIKRRSGGGCSSSTELDQRVEVIYECVVPNCQAPSLSFIGSRDYVGLFEENGQISVYSISTGMAIWKAEINSQPLAVSSSDDGSIICVAVEVGPKYPFVDAIHNVNYGEIVFEIYEVLDGECADGMHFVQIVKTGETKLNALALNYNGTFLAYAIGTKIKVHELNNGGGELLINDEWNHHQSKIYNLSWSLTGTKLVSTSADEFLIWDLNTRKLASKLEQRHHSGYNTFAQFEMENILITGGAEGLLTIHQIDVAEATSISSGPIPRG